MHDDYSSHATEKSDDEGEGEFWNIVFVVYVFSQSGNPFTHPASRLSDPYCIKETLKPEKRMKEMSVWYGIKRSNDLESMPQATKPEARNSK
jgi:hypothetical protein